MVKTPFSQVGGLGPILGHSRSYMLDGVYNFPPANNPASYFICGGGVLNKILLEYDHSLFFIHCYQREWNSLGPIKQKQNIDKLTCY